MLGAALRLLDELERSGADPLLTAQLRDELDACARQIGQLQGYPRLLEQAAALSLRGPSAAGVLDLLLDTIGASRGFLGFFQPGSGGEWDIVAARGTDGALDAPTRQLSSSLIARARRGERPVVMRDARQELPDQAESVHALRLRSVAVLPLGAPIRGFVYLDNPGASGLFEPGVVRVVEAFLPLLDQLLALAAARPAASPLAGFHTRSDALRARLAEVERAAGFDLPVLIHGETGTGKSHLAELIHQASARSGRPFVHVNCAAIPEALLEGELYGAEKGAYTGAQARAGYFEAARRGTLFLDELDSMPLHAQAKLLLAVQKRQISRLGSARTVDVDVRIIAAMAAEPGQAITAGALREDLYYRLSTVEVALPPLRERREDVPLLARAALSRSHEQLGLPQAHLTAAALDALVSHRWPGNVRELQNVLDRAAVLSPDGAITPTHLRLDRGQKKPPAAAPPPGRDHRGAVTAEAFHAAWSAAGGDLEQTAAALGIHRRSVYRLLKRFT